MMYAAFTEYLTLQNAAPEALTTPRFEEVNEYAVLIIKKHGLVLTPQGTWIGKDSGVILTVNFLPRFNMREIRDALGYSQRDFADALGVTSPCVSHWETKKRSPTRSVFLLLGNLPKKTGAIHYARPDDALRNAYKDDVFGPTHAALFD